MITVTLIITWWIIAGLITNAFTEFIWEKKRVTWLDVKILLIDIVRGPVGLAILIYYFVIEYKNQKRHE